MLKTVPLSDELREIFIENLMVDPVTNIFYILDLHDPESYEKSEFYLALEGGEIKGKLLMYKGLTNTSIWVRGSTKAISLLIKEVELPEKAVFHTDRKNSCLLKKRIEFTAEYPTEVMIMHNGEEKLFKKHQVKQLKEKHALKFLNLLREWHPSMGEIREEEVKEYERNLKKSKIYSIFSGEDLASIISFFKCPGLEDLSWIATVFTKEEHRGRGYATSLVSKAVSDAFSDPDIKLMGIMVRSTNKPAKRVYERVGFKTHRELTWLSLNTPLSP